MIDGHDTPREQMDVNEGLRFLKNMTLTTFLETHYISIYPCQDNDQREADEVPRYHVNMPDGVGVCTDSIAEGVAWAAKQVQEQERKAADAYARAEKNN